MTSETAFPWIIEKSFSTDCFRTAERRRDYKSDLRRRTLESASATARRSSLTPSTLTSSSRRNTWTRILRDSKNGFRFRGIRRRRTSRTSWSACCRRTRAGASGKVLPRPVLNKPGLSEAHLKVIDNLNHSWWLLDEMGSLPELWRGQDWQTSATAFHMGLHTRELYGL